MRRLLSAILALALAGAVPARTLAAGADLDAIFSDWNSVRSPGCVVGVQRAKSAPELRTYGMGDLERKLPLAPSTRLAAGSIAKMVTSLVVGTLVDEGKLALDADVRPMLPELRHYPAAITSRQLLSHTSGVRDFRQLLAMSSWRQEDVVEPADVSRVLRRQAGTSFVPGSDALYSNSEFFLLAELASAIAGRPFAEIARARVFTPLGMTDSEFVILPGQLVDDRATGYGKRGETGWRSFARNDTVAGPGALYATVPDLLRLLSNFESHTVGSSTYLALMENPARLANGTSIDVYDTGEGYGLGTEIFGAPGPREIGHDGSVPGFASSAFWLPDQHLSVAIECNTWALDVQSLMNRVIEAETGVQAAPVTALRSTRNLGGIVPIVPGIYQHARMRNAYFVHADAGTPKLGRHPLQRNADGTYAVQDAPGTQVAFRTTSSGQPELLLWNPDQIRPELYALRRAGNTPFRLSQAQLTEYGGTWYSRELDFSWEFVLDKGRLALIAPKWEADPEFFAPQFRDVFKGESGTIVEFTRDRCGTLTGFRATVDRARGVAFARRSGSGFDRVSQRPRCESSSRRALFARRA